MFSVGETFTAFLTIGIWFRLEKDCDFGDMLITNNKKKIKLYTHVQMYTYIYIGLDDFILS